jgi:hypothetical protein
LKKIDEFLQTRSGLPGVEILHCAQKDKMLRSLQFMNIGDTSQWVFVTLLLVLGGRALPLLMI